MEDKEHKIHFDNIKIKLVVIGAQPGELKQAISIFIKKKPLIKF